MLVNQQLAECPVDRRHFHCSQTGACLFLLRAHAACTMGMCVRLGSDDKMRAIGAPMVWPKPIRQPRFRASH